MSNETFILSIAFITCNRAQELIRALKSCNVEYLSYVEVIVWDNASTIENKRILYHYIEKCGYKIHYYYSDKNLGVAGGRNAVWKLCHGRYVFFLDDDAIVESKSFFSTVLDYMENNKKVGALGINIFEPQTGSFLNCPQYLVTNSTKLILSYVGAAHVLRKDIYPMSQLYPNGLMYGSEELYASLVIWNLGYEVHELQTVRVLHLPSNINRCHGVERLRNLIINQYIIKKLTYPKYMILFIYTMLRIRLFKHGIRFRDCVKLIEERFNSAETYRINTITLLKLIHLFGLRPLV